MRSEAMERDTLEAVISRRSPSRRPGPITNRSSVEISVDGASGAENHVVIDGIRVGSCVRVGTPGQFLVTDFVEELQVKSSGYAAELGGSTGGVLNVITRSGTNTSHGDALFYWSGDALDAAPRPTLQIVPTDNSRAQGVTYPEDRSSQLEARFTLGGPILPRPRLVLWRLHPSVPPSRPDGDIPGGRVDPALTGRISLGATPPSTCSHSSAGAGA